MDREKNDDYQSFPEQIDEDPPELLYLDPDRTNESEEDTESTGGLGRQARQRSLGRPAVSTVISRKNLTAEEEESSGGLASMGVSALVASYAAYAAAHAMQMAEHRGEGVLGRLAAVRAELQKRCIIDVLLPLLGHINPFVQVTAALDLLCSVFEQGDRAVNVLKIAQGGGRGFVPFLAGFALDTYFHAQLAPVPHQILSDATNIYKQLPRSIASFNSLPTPEKTMVWDGNEHTGTIVSLATKGNTGKYYAQHIGMNEYQVYRTDQLAITPQDGERYHISRSGALRRLSERAHTRGKL